ncbi:glycerol-3-phosphate ABC transporter ATP-binding protein [candidate division WOR-1 bacterium RIFOXYB2_FULL_42_35]|uniref:Glycerol-3-phosphate ABC transporter ATP-binding protein n=1 Tax=candidate division WOR-1 bacterium RIFOXYC2_FULL_41_25 TaxID=1802586 RepID=A0A1F4TNN7_UNCSA|nr:MAG: glycerol-3-phosphate ABC transporter ATP-binding protein [candidate division WOR-1 bacterium RIFOXYA2_FULL_41_14]OGC24773.1 MAG: glycerol-3-phosphate ABC transporter ATP-binding protein [candidate division WOR-1 bacterium RIFOXYB2_FULL_42_35]OGC34332.1 MAG: glycerol-3-phosphate ABC transporter ATP-binding protein [candidate division WOR-1 bacterium RIFOXYC2_FULL_41_25]OGC43324.1 MAG: glycerol-3-phosphate ABC transporter ATP-binding protein [candidate division WOR-1 bacterium RIFOXYD2_FUL
MARVLLQNVSKMFGKDVMAVKNINLEINDEEFVVLVGPSGCGKTTTLRMIAGLEEITEGKIYIGDRLINDVPPKDRNIAMVFQNYALYPHMKVYDNMAFGLKLHKMQKKEISERVRESASILGLEDLLDRYPKQLSGGQRQRVAVGRAIVRRPQVFLMDEPLSNLDAKLRVQMRAELQRLHKALKATVVYVTHDQVEAMTLGQRVAVILNGGLQQLESPLSVYEKPTNSFVAGFIGSPPMNFVKGTIDKKDNRYTFKAESFEVVIPEGVALLLEPYIGKEVTFGIRPEDIWDVPSSDWIKEKLYLDAKIDFREIIGAETYLYLHVGANALTTRVNGLCDASTGSSFKVVVNLSKLHFFDPRTQKAII